MSGIPKIHFIYLIRLGGIHFLPPSEATFPHEVYYFFKYDTVFNFLRCFQNLISLSTSLLNENTMGLQTEPDSG
jgi:hypothetical protein